MCTTKLKKTHTHANTFWTSRFYSKRNLYNAFLRVCVCHSVFYLIICGVPFLVDVPVFFCNVRTSRSSEFACLRHKHSDALWARLCRIPAHLSPAREHRSRCNKWYCKNIFILTDAVNEPQWISMNELVRCVSREFTVSHRQNKIGENRMNIHWNICCERLSHFWSLSHIPLT